MRTLKASLLLPLAGLREEVLDVKEKGEERALMWVKRG